jgi:microcystin-dependent protein
MAYTTFESDLLDAAQPFAYIPTGAILTLAAPYTTLSDSDLASLGLLKCDGTSQLVATYQNLWNVIGYTYGGSGLNFNVPNLHSQKLTIEASDTTNVVGVVSGSNTHQHSIGTVTWNSDDNGTSMAHAHNAYAGDRVFLDGNPTRHEHNGTLASYNGVPNTDASNATNGNTNNNGTRQHNHNLNYNAYNSSDSIPTAHTHNVLSQALSNNTQLNSTGTAFTNAHRHTTTLATTTTNQVTSADPHSNQYTVPYSPMLYFIKA